MAKIEVRAIQQDVYNINGDGKMGKGYVIHPSRYSTLHAEEVLDRCVENSHVPKPFLSAAMIALSACIKEQLMNGHSVEFLDLGYFSLTSKSTCVTDVDKVGIDQLSKFNIRFRPCISLKKELEGIEPVLEGIYDIAQEHPDGRKDYVLVNRHKRGRKPKRNQVNK